MGVEAEEEEERATTKARGRCRQQTCVCMFCVCMGMEGGGREERTLFCVCTGGLLEGWAKARRPGGRDGQPKRNMRGPCVQTRSFAWVCWSATVEQKDAYGPRESLTEPRGAPLAATHHLSSCGAHLGAFLCTAHVRLCPRLGRWRDGVDPAATGTPLSLSNHCSSLSSPNHHPKASGNVCRNSLILLPFFSIQTPGTHHVSRLLRPGGPRGRPD